VTRSMDVDVSLCVCRRGGSCAPDSVRSNWLCWQGVLEDHWLCRRV
jgi:hypothetical protein